MSTYLFCKIFRVFFCCCLGYLIKNSFKRQWSIMDTPKYGIDIAKMMENKAK